MESGTDATVSCDISGITRQLDAVVWRKDGTDVTSLSGSNYVVSAGTYGSNSQTTTLTVKAVVNTADSTYTCFIASSEWLVTNRQTNVLLNVFGKDFSVYYCRWLLFNVNVDLWSPPLFFYFTETYMIIFSAVDFEDRTVATGIDQSLTCTISGLSQDTPVTWIDPDNNEISNTDTNNYEIDQGTFIFGSKASTLTVKQSKLENLPSSSIFTCKLKSTLSPTYSPEVVKEMTLTLIGLSKHILILPFYVNWLLLKK